MAASKIEFPLFSSNARNSNFSPHFAMVIYSKCKCCEIYYIRQKERVDGVVLLKNNRSDLLQTNSECNAGILSLKIYLH